MTPERLCGAGGLPAGRAGRGAAVIGRVRAGRLPSAAHRPGGGAPREATPGAAPAFGAAAGDRKGFCKRGSTMQPVPANELEMVSGGNSIAGLAVFNVSLIRTLQVNASILSAGVTQTNGIVVTQAN